MISDSAISEVLSIPRTLVALLVVQQGVCNAHIPATAWRCDEKTKLAGRPHERPGRRRRAGWRQRPSQVVPGAAQARRARRPRSACLQVGSNEARVSGCCAATRSVMQCVFFRGLRNISQISLSTPSMRSCRTSCSEGAELNHQRRPCRSAISRSAPHVPRLPRTPARQNHWLAAVCARVCSDEQCPDRRT